MHKKASYRVAVISHLYPNADNPRLGIFIHEQVKALRRIGMDARVISFLPLYVSGKNPMRSLYAIYWLWSRRKTIGWDNYEGVPVMYIPYWIFPWGGETSNILSSLLSFGLRAKRIRDTFPFHLIHAHTAMLGGTAASLLARKSRPPIVITEHTGPFHLLTDTSMKLFLTGRALDRSDRVFAVSKSLKQAMALVAADVDVEILPNGLDTDRFSLQEPRPADGEIRMLWVGSDDLVKRVDRLLEAFEIAVSGEPRLRLTVLGANTMIDTMRKYVNSYGVWGSVSFLPPKNPSEMPQIYRECDFLVVSSDVETFGVSAIEALSCGKPVLATACGGLESIITHNDLGMVVDRSAVALAWGMVDMASKIETFDPQRVRHHAVENFDIVQVAQALAHTYTKLVAANRTQGQGTESMQEQRFAPKA